MSYTQSIVVVVVNVITEHQQDMIKQALYVCWIRILTYIAPNFENPEFLGHIFVLKRTTWDVCIIVCGWSLNKTRNSEERSIYSIVITLENFPSWACDIFFNNATTQKSTKNTKTVCQNGVSAKICRHSCRVCPAQLNIDSYVVPPIWRL